MLYTYSDQYSLLKATKWWEKKILLLFEFKYLKNKDKICVHTWRVDQRQYHVDSQGYHEQPRFSTLDHRAMQLQLYPLMSQSNRVFLRPNQLQHPPVIQYLVELFKKEEYERSNLNDQNESMPFTFADEYFLIAAIVPRTINLLWTNIRPINSPSWTILINADCHLQIKIKNRK